MKENKSYKLLFMVYFIQLATSNKPTFFMLYKQVDNIMPLNFP